MSSLVSGPRPVKRSGSPKSAALVKALGIVPQPKFSQGTIVTGALLAAWILWLAAQNKLCVYYQILLGGGAVTGSSGTSSGTSSNPLGLTFGNQPTFGNVIPYPFNQGSVATGGAAATGAAASAGGVSQTVPQN